jgi:Uma2 family endonuclease
MSTMIATPPRIEPLPEDLPRTEVTPEELLQMPDGGHYELVDGELKERKVSALSNLVAFGVGRTLGNHCYDHDLGWLFAADHGYRCFPWKPGLVRRADVSFIRKERYPWAQLTEDGNTTIPPDLAVEVVSPIDEVDDLDEKIIEYLRAGVKLIWVVHLAFPAVQIFRGDRTVSWQWAHEEISGEDVIPGFRCRVGDFFPEDAQVAAEPEPNPEPRQS